MADTALELRSEIKKVGKLEISLAKVAMPEPGPDEVLVRVEASPINPSDLGLLFGMADMTTAEVAGSGTDAVVTADVPANFLKAMGARLDQSLSVGNVFVLLPECVYRSGQFPHQPIFSPPLSWLFELLSPYSSLSFGVPSPLEPFFPFGFLQAYRAVLCSLTFLLLYGLQFGVAWPSARPARLLR